MRNRAPGWGSSREKERQVSEHLDRVGEEIARFGSDALFVTINPADRPHCVPVAVQWAETHALVTIPATSATSANLLEQPFATIVWSPAGGDTRHLVLDGLGDVIGDLVMVTPTTVALHGRAAGTCDETSEICAGDCELLYKM